MIRLLAPLFALGVIPALLATGPGPNPLVLPLWEGPAPNAQPSGQPEERVQEASILWKRHVQEPSIEVRLPARGNATRQAVIVCPGGGYGGLAYDWEGTDFAGWLNSRGVAAIILSYRLPADGDIAHQKWLSPLLDAHRAIRLVRAHAEEWNIDPAKIGIMGFSAGGHLASTAAVRFDPGDPSAADPVDQLSSRPDFAILVYPVISFTGPSAHSGSRRNLIGENPSEEMINHYSNELHVSPETPPTFLVHAADDTAVPVKNSLLFYEACLANGVPAELHIYPHGGHGFSFGYSKGRVQDWTRICARWLAEL